MTTFTIPDIKSLEETITKFDVFQKNLHRKKSHTPKQIKFDFQNNKNAYSCLVNNKKYFAKNY
jgi:hypothetical protein